MSWKLGRQLRLLRCALVRVKVRTAGSGLKIQVLE